MTEIGGARDFARRMMDFTRPQFMLLLLSFFAGAAQVVAPDRWFPASVLVWQKRWGFRMTSVFGFLALALHATLGFLIFLSVSEFTNSFPTEELFAFTLVLLGAVALLRSYRFNRLREVFQAGPKSSWGYYAVFSLLGPCEALIPILMKAQHVGMGFLLPFAAFSLGTAGLGTVMILSARAVWDHPLKLSRAFLWAQKRRRIIPVIASVVIGLTFLLR